MIPNHLLVIEMAHAILFNVPGMTREIYDQTLGPIDEAGKAHTGSRSVHVAYETPEGLAVLDVWESMEAFEAFGETLMPILAEAGLNLDSVEPIICPVHNTVIL